MCILLCEELGFTISGHRERSPARENDVCKKCGATLFGALTRRPLSAGESTEGNGEYAFTVTPYCPGCEKKPGNEREKNTKRKK